MTFTYLVMSQINVLDLFSGGGGFSAGFAQVSGYNIVAGVDFKESAVQTFQFNHDAQGIECNLAETTPEEFFEDVDFEPSDIDVVIGGPPCQGFSIANTTTEGHDERNTLVDVFLDYVEYIEPVAVVMENVPTIGSTDYPEKDDVSYADHTLDRLEEMGFNAEMQVLNAAEYGVPQKRRRSIFIATRAGTPEFPTPTHVPVEGDINATADD